MPNSNVPGPDSGGTAKNVATRGPNRKLTRRQEKFVKELVSNDGLITMREAAIRAGYPAASAHTRDLQKIRDVALENGAYSAAVQAEYRRGQAQGDIYVSKSEIRTGSIDQMSREDVERELERIRGSFEPIIDITPEEVVEQDSEGGAEKPGKRAVATNKRRSKKKRAED